MRSRVDIRNQAPPSPSRSLPRYILLSTLESSKSFSGLHVPPKFLIDSTHSMSDFARFVVSGLFLVHSAIHDAHHTSLYRTFGKWNIVPLFHGCLSDHTIYSQVWSSTSGLAS
jgi:hypothetical protein